MPWQVKPMSDIRLAFVHQVLTLGRSLTQSCREFGISRKTGYKWLGRFVEKPDRPLVDRSRRPRRSPAKTSAAIERRILAVRDEFGWGAPKIHAFLATRRVELPSVRTVTAILRRHGRIQPASNHDSATERFERPRPNQLWQLDFKGPTEVHRQRVTPLSVLDDHSRFLLALTPCTDCTMKTAWNVLWELMGRVGMPEAMLSDNAFSSRFHNHGGLSWFDSMLVRTGIRSLHGRPYHPQTQGKVERFHGTVERELYPRVRRDSFEHFRQDLDHWRSRVYNTIRPHEALGQLPPISRWRPSPRTRPTTLPQVQYHADAVLRKVTNPGLIQWHRCRIRVGAGLIGQYVRIEERDRQIAIFYAWKEIRCLDHHQIQPYTIA